jgi:quercetin dioxygenase-like cupin family protein
MTRSHLFRSRSLLALAACSLLVLGMAIGWGVARSATTPAAKRLALAQSRHVRGAPGRTLGLQKTIIPAHTVLPLHHHEGTQVAYIHKGQIRYTVHRGSAKVKRGLADQHPTLVKKVKTGESVTLRRGDWIIEQPSDHHSAVNKTNEKAVVYQATLLKTGAPPATPVTLP